MLVARTMLTFALLALPLAGLAHAQQVVDAVAEDPFQESYDPIPDASGGQLLGIRMVDGAEMAHGSGPLFLQPAGPASRICVEAHSGDGRYSAANPFRVPEASASWVRVAALSKAHKDRLDGYAVGEIAVRSYVVDGDSCTVDDPVLLPASGDPAAPALALEIQVNAGGLSVGARLSSLGPDGQPVADGASGECGPAGGGARLGFNTVCRLSLAAIPPGLARLDIEFDDGFVLDTVSHRILVPRPASP